MVHLNPREKKKQKYYLLKVFRCVLIFTVTHGGFACYQCRSSARCNIFIGTESSPVQSRTISPLQASNHSTLEKKKTTTTKKTTRGSSSQYKTENQQSCINRAVPTPHIVPPLSYYLLLTSWVAFKVAYFFFFVSGLGQHRGYHNDSDAFDKKEQPHKEYFPNNKLCSGSARLPSTLGYHQ